jgi:hypothetical protein
MEPVHTVCSINCASFAFPEEQSISVCAWAMVFARMEHCELLSMVQAELDRVRRELSAAQLQGAEDSRLLSNSRDEVLKLRCVSI